MKHEQFQRLAIIAGLLLAPIICNANTVVVPRCELASLATHVKAASAVFSGEVIYIRRTGDLAEIRFRVLRSWKRVTNQEITVAANPEDPEIVDFVKGRRYLVFAARFQDRLFAGGCAGTTELVDAQDEIRQLRKWYGRSSR